MLNEQGVVLGRVRPYRFSEWYMGEMGQCLGLVAKAFVPAAAPDDEAVDGSLLLNPLMMANVTADSPGDLTCVHPDTTMLPKQVALIERNRSELVSITTQINLERVVDELAPWIPKDKADYFKVCVSIVLFVLLLFPISFVSSLSLLSPGAPTQ